MNKCELCKSTARVYCNSDEARLCWSCDAKVHSANFLVARHVRNLLCHSCQSPTAWSGSGDKLGRTISLCEPCVVKNCVRSEGEREGSFESGTDFDSHEDEDEENVEEEEIYNQVVPLSSFTSPSAPPVVSSSGSQDRADIDINISPKRKRECVADLNSKDDADSLSLQQMGTAEAGSCIAGEEDSCMLSLRPFKFRKLEARRRPAALQTIQHRINTRTPVSGVKEAHECVDFDLNECPFD